ncbi:MAG: transposase [Pseudomonadota bacterium]
MSCYIRPPVTGARVFFTVCLAHRGSDLLVREVDVLRRAVAETRAERPFENLAWVVLPNHMHAVWQMPDGDREFGKRWGMIKSKFSRAVLRKHGWPKQQVEISSNGEIRRVRTAHHPAGGCDEWCAVRTLRASQEKRRELGIWQRRFWEHHIRDEAALEACIRYCWGNPVKHGLVPRAGEWPYSSIHRDIRRGVVEPAWAGAVPEMEAGEP